MLRRMVKDLFSPGFLTRMDEPVLSRKEKRGKKKSGKKGGVAEEELKAMERVESMEVVDVDESDGLVRSLSEEMLAGRVDDGRSDGEVELGAEDSDFVRQLEKDWERSEGRSVAVRVKELEVEEEVVDVAKERKLKGKGKKSRKSGEKEEAGGSVMDLEVVVVEKGVAEVGAPSRVRGSVRLMGAPRRRKEGARRRGRRWSERCQRGRRPGRGWRASCS